MQKLKNNGENSTISEKNLKNSNISSKNSNTASSSSKQKKTNLTMQTLDSANTSKRREN